MALIVKEKKENKIYFRGSDVSIPSFYSRVEFNADANGESMFINITNYQNKIAYDNEKNSINIDFVFRGGMIVLLPTQSQDLNTANLYCKSEIEKLGYDVEIVDL